MRRIVLLLCFALAALAAGAAARADGPQIVQDTVVLTNQNYFVGGPLCPGGFTAKFSAIIDRTTLNFYDDIGKLVIRRRHNQFTGSVMNSVTGYTLPYEGEVNFVFDFQAGTTTITGGTKRVIVPGEGELAIEAGRTVIDMSTGAFLDEDGQHYFNSQLCALLNQ